MIDDILDQRRQPTLAQAANHLREFARRQPTIPPNDNIFADAASLLEETWAALWTATHRHKKRGTEYVLIGIGKMQADRFGRWGVNARLDPSDGGFVVSDSVDMREVAIYRSVDDGSWWVRPREEWEDGRFEVIADD